MLTKKDMLFGVMVLMVSCAYTMDPYPLLKRDIKTLSAQEKLEYKAQLEEYRRPPQDVHHHILNQMQLNKEARENREKEKTPKKLEEKKDKQ